MIVNDLALAFFAGLLLGLAAGMWLMGWVVAEEIKSHRDN